MKKFICLLQILIIIILSCSCSGETEQPVPIQETLYQELLLYYEKKELTSYKELSSLYFTGSDIKNYDYSKALALPDENIESTCNFLFSVAVLKKAGIDVSGYNISEYTDYLTENLKNPSSLSTPEMCLAVFALSANGIEPDTQSCLHSALRRKSSDSGYFLYETQLNENQKVDIVSTSYALTLFTLFRENINEEFFDGALLYIGEAINENNTLSDFYDKESSIATSVGLTAMLASGIPLDGEISTSLLTAISKFAEKNSENVLTGYKEYSDSSIGSQAAAEVFFCASSARHGNIYIKLCKKD